MTSTVGVFVTSATDALFHFHFSKCWLTHTITVYNDIDTFKASKHNKKVACFQMPFPADPTFTNTVTDLLPHCEHILVLMSELHDKTVEFVQQHDNKQISYFICGDLNFNVENSPIHKFYDWFTTTVHFYKHERPQLLHNNLHPFDVKYQMFDALLGRKKLHRDIIFNSIDKESNVVTYINTHDKSDFSNPSQWRWESNSLVIEKPVEWTVERVNYHGHRMSLSQIVPIEVYNETAYSIIAETCFSNHYTFYTEKTVKPILGQRLFISVSGQYSLRNLHNIGFKTFSNVIDENYDLESALNERCNMAMDQVRYLSTQKQEDILEKIRPICEHNYAHMMRTDWYGQYFMPAFVSYFLQT
jgi:hypothetical protein